MLGTIYYRKWVFILATYYNYKSIEELNKYAKKYNTTPPSFLAELGKNTLGTYTIPEDSVESFNNIISFLLHSTLKDSHLLDDADNAISKTFKDLLIKYYENELMCFKDEEKLIKHYKSIGQCQCNCVFGGCGGVKTCWTKEMREYWS